MPAYVIAEHIVTDPAKFEEYRTKVGPMMATYGARYLTKGAGHKLPEGGHWQPAGQDCVRCETDQLPGVSGAM